MSTFYLLPENNPATTPSSGAPQSDPLHPDAPASSADPATRARPTKNAGPPREGSLTGQQSERLAAWLRLGFTTGVGPVSARLLARHFSSPDAVFAASGAELTQLLDEVRARAILSHCPKRERLMNQALEWQQEAAGAALVHLDHPAYPVALSALDDAPPVLFCQGQLHHLKAPALAIVGSRSASYDGISLARGIAQDLSDQGWLIVSGLAAGIDAAAHEGALAGTGATAAVLGTGVDLVYPRNNRALAARIGHQGLLISEQALGTEPARANFPRRNRIIAGLSLGVLVVQAARQSGSLITARLASDLGREVMAVPGSIHSPLSKGCHQLLREGATLVESANDVVNELLGPLGALALAAKAGVEPLTKKPLEVSSQSRLNAALNPKAHSTLRAMGWAPVTADDLADRLQVTPGSLSTVLLELELARQIERLDDGSLVRCKSN